MLFFLFTTGCTENESSGKIRSQKDTVDIEIDTTLTALSGNNVFEDSALFYQGNYQYEKTIYYLLKALECYRRDSLWEDYVYTLGTLGYNYVTLGQSDLAYYHLNRALTLAHQKTPDCRMALAKVYYALGYYYSNNYLPEKSIESYNKAIQLWKSPGFLYLCYCELGIFYLKNLKDYKKAEECYIRALKINEFDTPISLIRRAYCHYSIAIANQRIGDYAKAMTYVNQATDIYIQVNNCSGLEKCYSARGLIQIDMGKYDEAINNLHKALRLNIKNNDALNARPIHLLNLAYPYMLKGKLTEAVKYYKQAISLMSNKNKGISTMLGLTDSYLNLGRAYQSLNNRDSALCYYHKCIEASGIFLGSKHPRLSEAYQFLGRYYDETGQYDSALYYYQSAIIANVNEFNERTISKNPLLMKIGLSSLLYEVLAYKADVFMKKYYQNPASKNYLYWAMNSYSLCDSLMIRHKHILEYDRSKLKFIEVCHKNYEKYLECLYEIYQMDRNVNHVSCALNVMENNKSVLLANALKQAEALNDVGIPDSTRGKMEMLNKTITYLDGLVSEKAHFFKDTIQKQLFDARLEQEKLRDYLEKIYPVYSYYKYQSSNMELSEIRSRMKQNQYLIEYFQGEQNIYAISINKDHVIFYKHKKSQELDTTISVLRNSVSIVPELSELENNFRLFARSSYSLYRALVAPLILQDGSRLKKESLQLIIIPEGELALVPFDILIDSLPEGKNVDFKVLSYLIRSFYISYDYSVSLLFSNMSNRSYSDKVLAFGAADEHERAGDSINQNALPGSSNELQAISTSMNGVFYRGKDATESNFKSLASDYDIIHLALHGSADVNNANNCKVFFTSGGKSTEDGILYDYEVYALNLNTRLAVLTACETGLGKYYKGEGIFSIARGFIYAGCPSVVLSYWKIPDLTTSQQIKYFYQHLKKGEYVFEALRNAKINYLDQSDNITAHPVNWSSLNVWGKPDIRIHKRSSMALYIFAAGLTILVLFILISRRNAKLKKINP